MSVKKNTTREILKEGLCPQYNAFKTGRSYVLW